MYAEWTRAREFLVRTPAVLQALLRGQPEDVVTRNEGGETFSALEVVGHLIQGERADWIPRARIILEDGPGRPFEPFQRFAHRQWSRGRSVDDLLDEFERLRGANLSAMDALGIGQRQWAMPGTHPALGPVTLGQLLSAWVVHDQGHIAQVCRVLASERAEAVGPWRQYLRILG